MQIMLYCEEVKLVKKDLFETLREETGCEYISDLKYGIFNKMAKKFLSGIQTERWDLAVLSDAAKYIFAVDIDFETAEQAKRFFADNCK